VGRAAVVACCWLLRLGYFKNHCEVIDWVRAQRSPKAIETREQAQFVAGYQLWAQGGESRESSKLYEAEIKRRIDWTESNLARARELAASMNEHGHHHRPHQHQHEQHIVHHPQHMLRPQFAHSHSSNASISSTATVSSRQAVPVSPSSLSGAQMHKQEQHGSETKSLAPGATQSSSASISSTATVSSRQPEPVSPSSSLGKHMINGVDGVDHH
ncbi:hypothetical protein BGZ50_008620, partial [Haplosporangium sp. Z 11]